MPRHMLIAAVPLAASTWVAAPLTAFMEATIGHSLDRGRAGRRACDLLEEPGVTAANVPMLQGDLSNLRDRAIVWLDPGLARSFTPQSLNDCRIPAPALSARVVIADLPAMLESGALVENPPVATTECVVMPDAMHLPAALQAGRGRDHSRRRPR